MKKIEQKDLFELKNVAQPVVAGGDIFFTETKMNERRILMKQLFISTLTKEKYLTEMMERSIHRFKYRRMGSGLVLSVMKEKIKLLN